MDTGNIVFYENQIAIEDLLSLMSEAAHTNGLSDNAFEILYNQIDGLKTIYGPTIDKRVVFQILDRQKQVTETGRIREPVDIVEFVENPEYMNQGAYVRPAILENLYRLFNDEESYYEVVLGGAIGIGKNYFADMAVAYILYRMSCLLSPQAHYGLAPGSEIVFIHQSKTLNLARKVVFNQFAGRLRASGYFPRHFPFSSSYRAQLNFPQNISVVPVSSSDTAALGMNIFTAVLDELNFMARTKRSKLSAYTGEEEYDQAEKLYTTIHRRVESRYMSQGKVPGKIFLISSANYVGDFVDRKEIEAKSNPHIYIMHLAQWEALPPDRYCGKKFWVLLPSDKFKGSILKERPQTAEENLEVPIEYYDDFSRDLLASLRDIAGVAIARRNRLMEGSHVESAFRLYAATHGSNQIFKEPVITLEMDTLEQYLNLDFLRRIRFQGPFGAHVDLALTGDSAGVGIGHVVGARDIGTRSVFDPESGKFVKKAYGELPIYALPGLLRIEPPRGGEINLNTIRDLLFLIAEYIPLKWVTFDRFQSAALIQAFRSKSIASYVVSVDKTPQAYTEMKMAMIEERVYIPVHHYFEQEIKLLEQDATSGKVDHIDGESKDVADAVAGVVYEFSRKRMSYRKTGPAKGAATSPVTPKNVEESQRPTVGKRPSSGREPLY